MAIVRLTTCNDIIEATFIKDILENENIQCFLTNEYSTTVVPMFNGMMGAGIQVMIEDSDLEKANALINNKTNDENEIICPNCNSKNIAYSLGRKKLGKIAVIILSILTWVPFGNIKRKYICSDCKNEF
jgi:hypothetical protein